MARQGLRSGVVLILSMLVLVILSMLCVGIAAQSTVNLQNANNQRQAALALASAHSGLEILRYYLSDITIAGSVAPENRLSVIATSLQENLSAGEVTNLAVQYDETNNILTIPSVIVDSTTGQSFSATVSYGGDFDTVTAQITGMSGPVQKRVGVSFNFATIGNSIFDYGIATKGPLHMQGNAEVEGYNEAIEGNVYIESLNTTQALSMIGKSEIAGDVSIVNSLANVDISNASSVAGAKGDAALDHVHIGVPPCDFPTPHTEPFLQYVEVTFDPANDPTDNVTLTNIKIPAGANPAFSGNVVIRGIMFVEAPNVIQFTGNAEVTGIIVCDGDLAYPSSENRLEFTGNVNSYGVAALPDEGFADVKGQTGTFILAPGFGVSFGGNFETVNGVIAASGIEFFGNAGGVIYGSVVNYSDSPATLEGNTDLVFNRSGVQENPAGFEPSKIIQFLPSSYSEPPF